MADTKISDLTALTGANVADDDEFVIVDTSAAQSKRITRAELAQGLYQGDNVRLKIGASSDLQLYHDGTHSYISDQGTGNLRIAASDRIQFYNAATDEVTAQFIANGEAELRYDNTTRLATTSTGIDVTGTVTSDGLTVDGDGYFGGTTVAGTDYPLRIQNKDTGVAAGVGIEFSIDSVNDVIGSTIRSDRTGAAYHQSALTFSTRRANGSGLVDAAKIDQNGDISFYNSTGTSQALFWDASASRLGIGTTSPSVKLDLEDAAEVAIDLNSTAGRIYRLRSTTNNEFIVRDSSVAANRLVINGSGNVGIGTTSPTGGLFVAKQTDTSYSTEVGVSLGASASTGAVEVFGTSAGASLIDFSPTDGVTDFGGRIFYSHNTEHMAISTNGTERMRLTDAGLLVGKTSSTSTDAGTVLSSSGLVLMTRDDATVASIRRNTSDGDILSFSKDGTTVGSIGARSGDLGVATGNTGIRFYDASRSILPYDPTVPSEPANVISLGDSGSTFKDLYLSGDVNSGVTGTLGAGDTGVNIRNIGQIRVGRSGTATVTLVSFNNNNGEVGRITTSGSSTSYVTSSDYRLKENVTELTGAIDRVKQVPVHRFNFIADPNKTVDGFLAHEVQAIVPEAVHGEKDGMKTEEYEVTSAVLDDDGNVVTEAVMGTREVIEPQGIDQSKLVPLLTQALKDAITKIETLETRISALEGAN